MPISSLEASVHTHFKFLLDRFGFSIVKERYNQEMGNAVVVFAKSSTLIEVVKDRGQILLSLGDQQIDRREWIEFAHAVRFLSGNPGPVYSFPSEDNEQTQDVQVSHVASIMQEHCTPILSGEMTIVQLREAMRLQREQELKEFFASFQESSDSEEST